MARLRFLGIVSCAALQLSACDLAPKYVAPSVGTPPRFKEGGVWAPARPRDDAPHGDWWRCFRDPALDALEARLDAGNQDIQAAVARMERAQAFTQRAEAELFPFLQSEGTLSANKQSAHRPLRKADSPTTAQSVESSLLSGRPSVEPTFFGNNHLQLQASYEIDLWGRIHNLVASGRALEQANAADFETLALSLHAELARNYVELRGVDRERRLLEATRAVYAEALTVTRQRLAIGVASPADAPRAEAQLESVNARIANLAARRAALEHAIATLIGAPASSFSLARAHDSKLFAPPPRAVPSDLLQRRPDIAAAERRVAAANAEIGVARAAFFPRFLINLSGGVQDTGIGLLSVRNALWSVGPAVTLPIFDSGAKLAELNDAQAAYLETVAHYRQSVLRAIAEVEDSLSTLRWTKAELKSMSAAATAAQQSLDVSMTLYRDGAASFLDVVTAQTAALDAKSAVITLETRRAQAIVALSLALGGGWTQTPAQGADGS
jgi:outer membrane protein, multidrug efflux system